MHRVFWIETDLPGRMATMPRPLAEEIGALRDEGVDAVVSLLARAEQTELGLDCEGAECERFTMDFLFHPIEDRGLPSNFSKFVRLVDDVLGRVREGQTVAIHCRMGIGRASLLAAAVLVRSGAAPTDAWKRIEKARGCEVPDTAAQRVWVERLATSFSE